MLKTALSYDLRHETIDIDPVAPELLRYALFDPARNFLIRFLSLFRHPPNP